MRTVTFSTPEVQNSIQDNLVALNTNITGDPLAGESIWHDPDDSAGSCIRGNGRQNVQTIFLTPELRVLHAVTGFIEPNDLVDEMRFAASINNRLRDVQENRFDVVREMHRDRLKQTGFSDRQIDAENDVESMQSMLSGMRNSMAGMRNRRSQKDAGPMLAFERINILKDHRFSISHPMMSMEQLESDPGELVGRGKTFFSSSSSSQNFSR